MTTMMTTTTTTNHILAAKLIKQNHMTHETAAQNIMSQLSPTLKMRGQKNSRVKQCMDNSTGTLKDHVD